MELKDFKGKKTYIIMVAAICYALGGAIAGFHDWNTAIFVILGALGLGGVRNAIVKPKPEVQAPEVPHPPQ